MFHSLSTYVQIKRLIAACWLAVLLLVPYGLWGQDHSLVGDPKGVEGVFDCSEIDLNQRASIMLNGEWEFYWMELMSPSSLSTQPILSSLQHVKVPSAWNLYEVKGEPLGSYGYATYRLKVHLQEAYPNLAIKLNSIRTAAALYINGQLITEVGKVSKEASQAIAYRNTPVITFDNNQKSLDIVIHVSNHDHRQGGISKELTLGIPEAMIQEQREQMAIDLMLSGSILIMALYHFGLFALRRKDLVPLYFAIFCTTIFVRIFITGQMWIHVLNIDWPFSVTYRTDIISLFMAVTTFMGFSTGLFPKDTPKWGVIITGGFSAVGILIALFTPPTVYTQLVEPYQFVIFFTGIVMIYAMFKALRNRREGGKTYLMGWLFLFGTAMNDLLYDNGVINTDYYVHVGMLAFIFAQAFLLSARFSRALTSNEQLSMQLNSINKNLEATVEERTESLKEARDTLERKNQKVTHSINAAKRIQEAMLPKMFQIKKHLKDSFFFWKPRDIVSGDFYWVQHIDEDPQHGRVSVVVSADCTGHGIPGAFMSMSGIAFINQIITGAKIIQPHHILGALHQQVRRSMKQDIDNTQAIREGMDISVCTIYHDEYRLEFSGAKSPLTYIKNGEMQHIKGTRLSIGGVHKKGSPSYELNQIDYRGEEITFYLYSDGYQDKFGGSDIKKVMGKNFRKLLFDIYEKPMKQQERILEGYIQDWMNEGKQTQLDDMLVVGIKIDGRV